MLNKYLSILIGIIAFSILGVAVYYTFQDSEPITQLGAPNTNLTRDIAPIFNSTSTDSAYGNYSVGSSTANYFGLFARYASTTAISVSTGTATTTIAGGIATSTFAGGIQFTGVANICLNSGTCLTAGTGITSLNGLTGATQTFSAVNTSNDWNVLSISSSGTTHTFTTSASTSPAFGFLVATSTTALSKFYGPVTIDGTFTVAAGEIGNTELANSSLTVTAGTGLADGGAISLGSSATLNVGAGTCITANANDVAVTTNCTDATTLDSIEGASLLRSDASDSYTSGTLTFDASTILDLTAASLRIPNAAAPTVTTLGYMALDTTNNELLMATSTTGGAVVYAQAIKEIWGFELASTSPIFKAGETQGLSAKEYGFTVYFILCNVWGGESIVLNLVDGAQNDTNTVTCDTTTSTQRAIVTNNTWTPAEGTALEIGTITGSINKVYISIWGVRTRR